MESVTKMSSGEIVQQIRKRLMEKIELKERMDCQFITLEMLDKHEGDDFMQAAAYKGLRNMVRIEVNRLAGDDDTGEGAQLKLPGYEHAHAYYSVVRESREIAVPVEAMTRIEFNSKISLYEKFSVSNAAHADELRRLRDELHGVVVGA